MVFIGRHRRLPHPRRPPEPFLLIARAFTTALVATRQFAAMSSAGITTPFAHLQRDEDTSSVRKPTMHLEKSETAMGPGSPTPSPLSAICTWCLVPLLHRRDVSRICCCGVFPTQPNMLAWLDVGNRRDSRFQTLRRRYFYTMWSEPTTSPSSTIHTIYYVPAVVTHGAIC